MGMECSYEIMWCMGYVRQGGREVAGCFFFVQVCAHYELFREVM